MIVSEEIITAFAAQFDPNNSRTCPPPLMQEERTSILQEITNACGPGDKIKTLRDAPDQYLCMALVTAWSLQYVERAFDEK